MERYEMGVIFRDMSLNKLHKKSNFGLLAGGINDSHEVIMKASNFLGNTFLQPDLSYV